MGTDHLIQFHRHEGFDHAMHVHIHNELDNVDQPMNQAEWDATGIAGHRVTIGSTPEEFLAQAKTVEALIAPTRGLKKLDLFATPKLRLLQLTSAGVDSLQPFDHIPPGVLIMNNRGTHSDKAGEYALMAILMLVNAMPRLATAQRDQHWHHELRGVAKNHRLTVVGLGSLGGAAAMQASRLGMQVTGVSRLGEPHPHCARTVTTAALDAVLPETDILLLACPLTQETRNLLCAERIKKLPERAGIINIGRGRLVDEEALLDALEAGTLGGAILDVFHTEPLPKGHRAWTTKNLIITPHMSSDDPGTYNMLTLQIFKKNLTALAAGEKAPTAIDRVLGY
jgi:glyoxylate/hydroxypyruvate reductase A